MLKILSVVFFATILMTISSKNSYSQNNGKWIEITSGSQIPANAVVGGRESTGEFLYPAVAYHDYMWIPGKTRRDWNFAEIFHNGQVFRPTKYKVLVNNEAQYTWKEYVYNQPENNSFLYEVETGNYEICSCDYQNSIQVGSKRKGTTSCSFSYGNGGYQVTSHKILCMPEITFDQIEQANKSGSTITATKATPTGSQISITDDPAPAYYLDGNVVLQPVYQNNEFLLYSNYQFYTATGEPGKFAGYFRFEKNGSADCSDCIAIETPSGYGRLMQRGNTIVVSSYEWNNPQYERETSFRRRRGLNGTGNSYESLSLPGYFLTFRDNQLSLSQPDNSTSQFASFGEFFRINDKSLSLRPLSDPTTYVMAQAELPVQVETPTEQVKRYMNLKMTMADQYMNCWTCCYFSVTKNDGSFASWLYVTSNGLIRTGPNVPDPYDRLFIRKRGLAGKGFSFEFAKKPGYYLKVEDKFLVIAPLEDNDQFKQQASFEEVAPVYRVVKPVF